MNNIEWIDKDDDLLEITDELWNLKEEINENSSIEVIAETYWISHEVTEEYINILKDYFGNNNIDLNKSIDLTLCEKLFWDVDNELDKYQGLDISMALNFFNFKKRYPDKYKSLIQYYFELYFGVYDDDRRVFTNSANRNINNEKQFNEKFFWLIDNYWDSIVKYLQYCEPRKWTNIRNSVPITENYNDEFNITRHNNESLATESHAIRSMAIHFFDIFENEPEAWNLFNFLETHPQKLDNLWWKEVKLIDLDINKWINFCFRGIMEMVKSRPDINFPHISENPTESEKRKRENDWQKIIKEYEQTLRNYIAKDFNPDWTEKEREKTFDKIFFSSIDWDDVMHMWDDIISKSVWFLSENEKNLYTHKVNYSDDESDLSDNDVDSEATIRIKHKKMLSDIENYASEHPNEKILVCIDQHWNPDWSSSNLWSKEDWIKLANISPNIKIWSVRCFFWTAFENKDIYNHKSSVSWFSNESVTSGYISNVINYAYSKWVWFHEMEILARMNYNYSVTSLTESMEYTNWNTWKTEIWKVGLAQNNGWQSDNLDNNYA